LSLLSKALVLAKCLHYLIEEGEFKLKGKNILELGSGVGLLAVYLAALGKFLLICLGCNVAMTDMPAMKELAERNANINRKQIEQAKDKI
jgi:predicted RNA methylase